MTRIAPHRDALLHGTFTFSPTGELVLQLTPHCTIREYVERLKGYFYVPCTTPKVDTMTVTAVTPWRQEIHGEWTDARHISFRADWAYTGLDPFSEEAAHLTTGAWRINSRSWQPSLEDAARMLELIRTLRVAIPLSETAPNAMLVLDIGEGNGFTPRNASRRVQILASVATPVLGMQCAFAGQLDTLPEIDAGERVALHCVVENTGAIAAHVVLEATITRSPAVVAPTQIISAGGQAAFDIPLTVPRDFPIDSKILVLARDTVFSRTARAVVPGVIRRSRMCEVGKLTAGEYRAKIAELRAATSAGYINQAQFDRYDAELVGCLR
jgi:hypothetical protein